MRKTYNFLKIARLLVIAENNNNWVTFHYWREKREKMWKEIKAMKCTTDS